MVTRNEVDQARQHPGLCWMGVWPGMRITDGVVDPDAGTFRILPFNSNDGQLLPRDFDWTLPGDVILSAPERPAVVVRRTAAASRGTASCRPDGVLFRPRISRPIMHSEMTFSRRESSRRSCKLHFWRRNNRSCWPCLFQLPQIADSLQFSM